MCHSEAQKFDDRISVSFALIPPPPLQGFRGL
jgi:hypothetical protein